VVPEIIRSGAANNKLANNNMVIRMLLDIGVRASAIVREGVDNERDAERKIGWRQRVSDDEEKRWRNEL
jgi:hypothetical protein